MEHTYKVVFTGKLYPEIEADRAIEALATKFGISAEQAGTLVRAERPTIVKKGLDRVKGKAFCLQLKQIGLKTKLVEEKAETDKTINPPAMPSRPSEKATTSKSAKRKTSSLSPVNPYATPKANLEPSAREKKQRGDPQKVPAGHGWRWLVNAYGMLKEHPWAWTGAIVVMYLFVALPGSIIPVIGSFAGYLLAPIFSGGIMLGAHEQEEGGKFRFNHLFAGFSTNRNQLLLLGLFSVLGILACSIPFIAFFGITFFTGGFDPATMNGGNIAMFMLGGLLSMALVIPFYMAIWFTPVLVAVGNEDAWPAMKLSFKATRKNILPFLVYGLSIMGLIAVFGIGAAILIPLSISMGFEFSSFFVVIPMMLGVILMLPVMTILVIAVYTGYRDIFYQ